MIILNNEILEELDNLTTEKLRPVVNCSIGTDNKYHYVYIIIHIDTKRFYIGKRTELKDTGYYGSGFHIKRAINLYGKQNFCKFIIGYYSSSGEAYDVEQQLISEQMILSKMCFNSTFGGGGFVSGDNSLSQLLSDSGKSPAHLLAINGCHPAQDHRNGAKISSKKGTHHWIGDNNPTKRKSLLGLNPETVKKKLGIVHKWQGDANINKCEPWNNTASTYLAKYTWSVANILYNLHLENPEFGRFKILKLYENKFNILLAEQAIRTILNRFRRQNWNPLEDKNWINFKLILKG